jgi:DNA repair protein RecO (recombination protein O)
MPLVSTTAIILATSRYSETSKIVRLVTRDHGVQSAIAKGALRPKSRYGAALQLMSVGVAHLIVLDRRDLQVLTGFDLQRLHVELAKDMDRYSAASALAELTLRCSPSEPHPEVFDFLEDALVRLEQASVDSVQALGLRLLWTLTGLLGFAPGLDSCVRDGAPLDSSGELHFGTEDGGALCAACARTRQVAKLPREDREDLESLLDLEAELPRLDERHAAAHRRLLNRYIRHHVAEESTLPALDFWMARPWVAA